MSLTDQELMDLYKWVDQMPLSKSKKNINRDFSDGVSVAMIVKAHFPKLVDLHNYPSCSAAKSKRVNWQTLNMRVFKKLQFELDDEVIEGLVNSTPHVLEHVLHKLRNKIDQAIYYKQKQEAEAAKLRTKTKQSKKTEVDQYYDSPGRKAGIGLQRTKAQSPTRGPVQPFQPRQGFPERQRKQQSQVEQVHIQPDSSRGLPDSETVSTLMYDEKCQESLAKGEMIEILKAKVNQLEHLIHLKNVKVDALGLQLESLRFHDKKNHAAAANSQQKRLY